MTDAMSSKRKRNSMRPLMERHGKRNTTAALDRSVALDGLGFQPGEADLTSRRDSTSPGVLASRGSKRRQSAELLRVSDLKPAQRNARTHSHAQIRQIARSIERFGFVNPIIVDASNRIVAGHGRALAAQELRLREVPVIRLEGLTQEEARAYALADNRIAELAGWDKEILALELQDLSDIGFDLEVTGFEVAEIDALILDLDQTGGQKETDDAADSCPLVDRSLPATARSGDLWRMDNHLLAVGDARNPADWRRLMQGCRATAAITDPPYNVKIAGFASGKGRVRHGDFAMASGEMSPGAFRDFLTQTLGLMKANVVQGGFLAAFMDWRHIAQLVAAGDALALRLLNICVWIKPQGGMGSFYRSQHEFVGVFANGERATRNNIQLGRFGRNRTNVWHYARPNPLTPQGRTDLGLHPTVKPVAMIADALLDMSKRNDIVVDPFAGSGTIFVAAEKTGRRAHGIEIDPHYAGVCITRWQQYTGEPALLAETGETFEQVTRRRRSLPFAAGSDLTAVACPRKRKGRVS